MKIRSFILLFLAMMLAPAVSLSADSLLLDKPAPFFKVSSGADEVLTSDELKGRVVVLFYETKETIEVNRQLKKALNEFYDAQNDTHKKILARVAVVNCRGVFFTGAWKSALRANSQKEGIIIYGDWDGSMASHYNMKAQDSNVLVLDQEGNIRYFESGKLADSAGGTITKLLHALVAEKQGK